MDSLGKTFVNFISNGQRFSRNLDHIFEKFEELSKDENNLDEVDVYNFAVTNTKGFFKKLHVKEKVFGKSKMATDEAHGSHCEGRDDKITDNARKPSMPADPLNIVSACSGETVSSQEQDESRSPDYKGIMFRSLLDLDESIRMDNLIDSSEGESLSSVSIISSKDEESDIEEEEDIESADSSPVILSEFVSDEVGCEASESSNADDSDQDLSKKSTSCNDDDREPSLDEDDEACFGEIPVSEQFTSSINTSSNIGKLHSCKRLFSPAGRKCATSLSTSGTLTGVSNSKEYKRVVVPLPDHLVNDSLIELTPPISQKVPTIEKVFNSQVFHVESAPQMLQAATYNDKPLDSMHSSESSCQNNEVEFLSHNQQSRKPAKSIKVLGDRKSSRLVKRVFTTLLASDSSAIKLDANKRKTNDETFVVGNRAFSSEAQNLTPSPCNLFTNSSKPGDISRVLLNGPASKRTLSLQQEGKVTHRVTSPASRQCQSTESDSSPCRISMSQGDASRCHNIKSLISQQECASCQNTNVDKKNFNYMHKHNCKASNKFTDDDDKKQPQAKRVFPALLSVRETNSCSSHSTNRMNRQQPISKNFNNEMFTFENSDFLKSVSDSRTVNTMPVESLKSIGKTTFSYNSELHLPYINKKKCSCVNAPERLCVNASERLCTNEDCSKNCMPNKSSLNETFIKNSILLPTVKPECFEYADDESNQKSENFLDVSIIGCSPDVSQTRGNDDRKPSHILVNNDGRNINSVQPKCQMSKVAKSSSSCESSFIHKNIFDDNIKLNEFRHDKFVTRREQCLKLPEITESNLVKDAHIQTNACYNKKSMVGKEDLNCMLKAEITEKQNGDLVETLLFRNGQYGYRELNSITNPIKAHGNSNSYIPDLNVLIPLDLSRSGTMQHTVVLTDAKIETIGDEVSSSPGSQRRSNEMEVKMNGKEKIKFSASRCSKSHKEQETLSCGKESRANLTFVSQEKFENLQFSDIKLEEAKKRRKEFFDSYKKFRADKLERGDSVMKSLRSVSQIHEMPNSFPRRDDDSLCQETPVSLKTSDRVQDFSAPRGSFDRSKYNKDSCENFGTPKEPKISIACNKVESNLVSLRPENLNVSNSKEEADRRRKEFKNSYKKFRADRVTVSESERKSLQSVSHHSLGVENCSLLDDSDFLYQNKKVHHNISSSIDGSFKSPRNSLLLSKFDNDVLVSDDTYQISPCKIKQCQNHTESTEDDVFNISNYSDSLYSLTKTRKRKRSEVTRPDLNRSDNKLSYSVKAKMNKKFVSGCDNEYEIDDIHNERFSVKEGINIRKRSDCNDDSSSYSDQVSPAGSEIKRSRTESRDSIEDIGCISSTVRWLSKTRESRRVPHLLTCLK